MSDVEPEDGEIVEKSSNPFSSLQSIVLNGLSVIEDGIYLLKNGPEEHPEQQPEPEEDARSAALRAPRRQPRGWGGFVHLLARNRMNYRKAVMKAARRKRARSVDIDTQHSAQGTPWALHWNNIRKNKLHDPHGKIHKNADVSALTDAQIGSLIYPDGTHPEKLQTLLELAADHNVRVEVESKAQIAENQWLRLLDRPKIRRMLQTGHLQVKTLAAMPGAAGRLSTAHHAGIPTILSFTKYRGRGLSKRATWPVVDYIRGRARWVA